MRFAFDGQISLLETLTRLVENTLELCVAVRRVVMEKKQLLRACFLSNFGGLHPRTVTPAVALLILFRRKLRIENQNVGVACSFQKNLVQILITMLQIAGKYQLAAAV